MTLFGILVMIHKQRVQAWRRLRRINCLTLIIYCAKPLTLLVFLYYLVGLKNMMMLDAIVSLVHFLLL